MLDSEIKKIMGELKSYAKAKGARNDEIDDFAQEAIISILGGRKASFGHLYIDYLRKTYGDQRSSVGIERSRSTLFYADIDDNMLGGDLGNGLSDRENTRHFEKIYETLEFNEWVAIQARADFSQPRQSQLKKAANEKIKEILDYQHGYHLMETEDLWVDWITI